MPSDSVLFEELVQAFSLAMVTSTSSSSSLATFCQAKHREAMLSQFPAHIGSGPFLFDDDVLSAVLTASREDSAVSTNITLTKAVSSPAFGAGKSDRKASDRTSNASSSSASSRGKGRGSVADRFHKSSSTSSSSSSSASQERKRKSDSPSRRSAKSSRRSVNSGRGGGFRR